VGAILSNVTALLASLDPVTAPRAMFSLLTALFANLLDLMGCSSLLTCLCNVSNSFATADSVRLTNVIILSQKCIVIEITHSM
jgi:hypothetical protein